MKVEHINVRTYLKLAGKENKYHAKKKEYKGINYDSTKEAEYANSLDLRKAAKEIKDWTPQVKMPIYVDGSYLCDYVIDFLVVTPDGSVEWHEVKGMMNEVSRLKIKLFKLTYLKYHPDEKFILIR